jgi:hypothetical protein
MKDVKSVISSHNSIILSKSANTTSTITIKTSATR